jgi:hypothetical protein
MRKRNRELSSTVPEPKTRFQGSPGELDGDLRDDVDGVGDQLEMRGLLDGVFAVGLFAAISSFHFRENLGYPQRTGHWAATTQNEGMNHTND